MFGLAGTIMQDALRNPMAGPEFLGVASGASLFVAFVALFPVGLAPVWHQLLALVAGVVCGGAILGMTHRATDRVLVLLTGAAFTTLLRVPFFLRLLVRSR